jgi:hypothetical protein
MGYALSNQGPTITPKGLAAILRAVHGLPRAVAIEQLVRDMNAVEAYARSVGYPEYFLYMGALGGKRMSNDLRDRLRRTQSFFDKLRITLYPQQPGKHGWTSAYFVASLDRKSDDAKDVIRVVGFLIWKLGLQAELWRVRECRHCGTWFAAKKSDNIFCVAKCCEKAFRTTPQGRAKRKMYMKRYRANVKRMAEAYESVAKKPKRKAL